MDYSKCAGTIPEEVLRHPVAGINIKGPTFADELGAEPTYAVFLRHLGCVFCRQLVDELRLTTEQRSDFPPVIIFYQGTTEQGEQFFQKKWPTARAIADLSTTFYKGFHLKRGSFSQMFGARVWASGIRAISKGFRPGKVIGDPWMMPGIFLIEGSRIAWLHAFRHAGDHPALQQLPTTMKEAATAYNLEMSTSV
ncbi:SelL-related redox protein [Acanthopleuribacter pedis]|uniref:AhpC/TSA family protein n=1 Tax=Acanthopleuribacter pedis TaxID=442870 RepID=A0A8J7U6W8_9BACT|nr:SelL-related redox protein [Acanthopleuribacter pedis]MBO1321868.1 hypothetical protein [Acanthopleuribacter pedis]